jgi:nucleotide-binding universal stress UspA family protein
MAVKTILLHLCDERRAARLLSAAVPVARAQSAHLIGLSVVPPYVVIPAGDEAGTSLTVDEHRTAYRTEARRMKEMFLAATSDLPMPAEWRDADADFQTVTRVVVDQARTADLVIAAQTDGSWANSNLLEDPVRVIMESGRPVLLVPNAGHCELPPQRATIAYDGRREAARALFDSLPLLQTARDVSLVWINPEKMGSDLPATEICSALSRHGIKATAIDAHAIGADVGLELMRQAKLQGADMLVMGCYGHSRLRELILGGASRHVLTHMDLPVLMSH